MGQLGSCDAKRSCLCFSFALSLEPLFFLVPGYSHSLTVPVGLACALTPAFLRPPNPLAISLRSPAPSLADRPPCVCPIAGPRPPLAARSKAPESGALFPPGGCLLADARAKSRLARLQRCPAFWAFWAFGPFGAIFCLSGVFCSPAPGQARRARRPGYHKALLLVHSSVSFCSLPLDRCKATTTMLRTVTS